MRLVTTPSQTVGPYVHIGFDPMTVTDLAKDAAGERIVVAGRVLDGAGQPIPDAVLELWQANAAGRYAHPEDAGSAPLDPAFLGFGRVPTDGDGRFRFTTIRPGAAPGPGNTLQAPHIVVCLFMRGLLRHLFTRIYLEDAPENAGDPILALIDEPARRGTLLARRTAGEAEYRWDIVMQGDRETVFFDV
ncbi:MAG: protocatechuate 3,4-dioxygenase subunit alpha [Alphaproteobacteria bacterium]|nr:protocatechuate 3,4-dioxygenase subunit alpha [Alphaproteobacteria bacterium]